MCLPLHPCVSLEQILIKKIAMTTKAAKQAHRSIEWFQDQILKESSWGCWRCCHKAFSFLKAEIMSLPWYYNDNHCFALISKGRVNLAFSPHTQDANAVMTRERACNADEKPSVSAFANSRSLKLTCFKYKAPRRCLGSFLYLGDCAF